ncbi:MULTISPECIES: PIN domain-containing protein [unclassified Nitratiruptor]|uniref:type II toxin-antitoxin system VapC family toxin n=1 Tax=unclassified Nitratiruptor TaxID=2624044 RepID=UPI001915A26D|nr:MULTISPECIES: PIN domain-containing protein [unclassified Nitratiruptor]
MITNIFLDTNIIIDFLDESRSSHHLVVRLIAALIEQECEIFITEDMLSTIYYLVKDKQKVLHFFKDIIDDWNIIYFDKDVIKNAIEFALRSNVDFEDALQCFAAKKHKCIFITHDKKFVDCGIEIFDCKGFLEHYNFEKDI